MKKTLLILLVSIVAVFVIQLFFTPYITAQIANIPFIKKLGIIQPQNSLVINRREEIRVSDSEDVIKAINSSKSRLASIVRIEEGNVVITGNAFGLTQDGYFMSSRDSFQTPGVEYFIYTNDGRTAPIKNLYFDQIGNWVFVKTDLTNVNVAPFAQVSSFVSGQKLVFAKNGPQKNEIQSQVTYFNSAFANDTQTHSANAPTLSLSVEPVGAITPGEVIINLNGEIAGMWDGLNLISASTLRRSSEILFGSDGFNISRPAWGFDFRYVSDALSDFLSLPKGIQVVAPIVVPNLVAGDVIIDINGAPTTDLVSFYEILNRFRPGDKITFRIVRDKNVSNIDYILPKL